MGTRIVDWAKVGDKMFVIPPVGKFLPVYEPNKHLVCIAGGSGVTPFRAFAREATRRKLDTKITVLYSVRQPKDIIFNTEFRQLQDEVRRQGPLSFIDCVRHRPANIVQLFPGENPLQAAMVHDLYAVQVLMNRAEPSRFQAVYHRTQADQVDLANAQLQWPDGSLASFVASYLTPSGMPPRGFDRMEVFGDGWSARITPNPRPIEVWSDTATWPLPLEIRTASSGPTGMMAEELRTFCRVVRGLVPVPLGATYTDALQVQQWMERLAACAQG